MQSVYFPDDAEEVVQSQLGPWPELEKRVLEAFLKARAPIVEAGSDSAKGKFNYAVDIIMPYSYDGQTESVVRANIRKARQGLKLAHTLIAMEQLVKDPSNEHYRSLLGEDRYDYEPIRRGGPPGKTFPGQNKVVGLVKSILLDEHPTVIVKTLEEVLASCPKPARRKKVTQYDYSATSCAALATREDEDDD